MELSEIKDEKLREAAAVLLELLPEGTTTIARYELHLEHVVPKKTRIPTVSIGWDKEKSIMLKNGDFGAFWVFYHPDCIRLQTLCWNGERDTAIEMLTGLGIEMREQGGLKVGDKVWMIEDISTNPLFGYVISLEVTAIKGKVLTLDDKYAANISELADNKIFLSKQEATEKLIGMLEEGKCKLDDRIVELREEVIDVGEKAC